MKNFFKFSSKHISSTLQAHAVELGLDENGTNNHWNLIKGIYHGIDFPVIFKQVYGNKLHDILHTGWPGLYLISEKMQLLLKNNHLTGWKVFPIKLYAKKDNEIFGYYGFSITGHCGPTSYAQSEIIEKRLVPNGPICKYYKGIFIDKWDGTDFFTPEGTYQTFITKKAADILKKNKISNMILTNLSVIEINVRCVKNGNDSSLDGSQHTSR